MINGISQELAWWQLPESLSILIQQGKNKSAKKGAEKADIRKTSAPDCQPPGQVRPLVVVGGEWSGGGQQPAGDKSGVIMLAGSSGTSAVARPAAAPP